MMDHLQVSLEKFTHSLDLSAIKTQMIKLQKAMTFNKKSGAWTIKCNLFDIPNVLWNQTNFDGFGFSDGSISFADFAKNKGNFEFLKNFSSRNDH